MQGFPESSERPVGLGVSLVFPVFVEVEIDRKTELVERIWDSPYHRVLVSRRLQPTTCAREPRSAIDKQNQMRHVGRERLALVEDFAHGLFSQEIRARKYRKLFTNQLHVL